MNRFVRKALRTALILGLFFAPGDRLLTAWDVASAQTSNVGTGGGTPAGGTYAGFQPVFIQNGIPSFVKTYRLAVYNQAWASQTGNLVQVQGSATKTIHVTKVIVDGQATAAVFAQVSVQRASAAQTSGTCTSQTGVTGAGALSQLDTTNTAPTAVISLCTAAATAGTANGAAIDVCRLAVGAVGTPTIPDICALTYGINDDQMLTLRGTGDYLGIATGTFGTAGVVDVVVEWTEEP